MKALQIWVWNTRSFNRAAFYSSDRLITDFTHSLGEKNHIVLKKNYFYVQKNKTKHWIE